jgi:membrane-associated phospholipid phosphatase
MTSGNLLDTESVHRAHIDKRRALVGDADVRAHDRASRRARSRRVCAALALAALVAARAAHADATLDADAAPTIARSRTPSPSVEWTWPRFRWWEYAGTTGVYVADVWVRFEEPPPDHPRWIGQNPFDDTIRGWLRGGTLQTRQDAVKASDWLSWTGTAYPFAIDLPVALLAHREPGVMWQLLMMDLEANSVAGLINNSLFHFAGRGRPSTPDCAANPGYDALCGDASNNASLPSGHVLTIATAAGLVCVHHRYLPLYGSEAADAGACVLLSAATVATGVARIVADRHFATDMLIGAAIGYGSGYGLPWALHYRYGRALDGERPAVSVLPLAGPSTLGLSLVGVGPL